MIIGVINRGGCSVLFWNLRESDSLHSFRFYTMKGKYHQLLSGVPTEISLYVVLKYFCKEEWNWSDSFFKKWRMKFTIEAIGFYSSKWFPLFFGTFDKRVAHVLQLRNTTSDRTLAQPLFVSSISLGFDLSWSHFITRTNSSHMQ